MKYIANAALVKVLSVQWGGKPLIFWEWHGQRIRVGKHAYLKSIGNGLAIRENTGEVYEEFQVMESLFR